MSGFSVSWLAMREPVDHASRARALTEEVASRLAGGVEQRSARTPLRILDLGTGTGSNARYLVPWLGRWQAWTVVDADAGVLGELPVRMAAWASRQGLGYVQRAGEVLVEDQVVGASLRPHAADISTRPLDVCSEPPALVTASALLDLVSERWTADLVSACRAAEAIVLFPLIYNGLASLEPATETDRLVLELVNRHQRTDKGFGAALGPDAARVAAAHFERAGYEVRLASSDWHLRGDDQSLQRELVSGWAQAAQEVDPSAGSDIRAWETRRQAEIDAGTLAMTVGHTDLAAWLR